MVDIICATRLPEGEFWKTAALGISLNRLAFDQRLALHIAFENRLGLPDVYNERIAASDTGDLLVFVHDDVWLDDYFLGQRVVDGLQEYDVIGVVGNRRRAPGQPAWPFPDNRFNWDEPSNLSGGVAHGQQPFGPVSFFGPTPADCELMDGLFLAARKTALLKHQVQFDPRFDFHFYDVDFCRAARNAGLRLGTWPIAMTHQSSGRLGSVEWRVKYKEYLEKWGS